MWNLKGAGGRPAYDKVMMFKILILQKYYNLSDEQTEFQINDRTSFKQFLDLKLGDTRQYGTSKSNWLIKMYHKSYLNYSPSNL